MSGFIHGRSIRSDATRARARAGRVGGLWEATGAAARRCSRCASRATRMGRGDVRAAVLALLAEQPMHGYQIIQRDRGAQRRHVEAEPRLGLSDAAAARRRGPDQRRGVERAQDLLAHRRGSAEADAAATSRRRGSRPARASRRGPGACRRPAWISRRRPRRWVAPARPEQVQAGGRRARRGAS